MVISMKIGITGHQELGSSKTIDWIREQIQDLILKEHICEGYTSLAIGADQLYADILQKQSVPFVAVIPSSDYIKTFPKGAAQANYKRLLSYASHVVQLKFPTS